MKLVLEFTSKLPGVIDLTPEDEKAIKDFFMECVYFHYVDPDDKYRFTEEFTEDTAFSRAFKSHPVPELWLDMKVTCE